MKKKKHNNPDFKSFDEFVKYHFGTKSEFAKQMGISRPTAHQWIAQPGTMSVGSMKKVYDLTKDNGGDIVNLAELCLQGSSAQWEGEE
jgi:hypothetical protein